MIDVEEITRKIAIEYHLALYGFVRHTPSRCEHGKPMSEGCKKCLQEVDDETH